MSAGRAPARLEELPTVLDSAEAMSVLRIGKVRLGELVAAGRIRRLAYDSRQYLFDSREIRRFLRSETERDS